LPDTSNRKGRLLEEVVKKLYDDLGWRAEKRAFLPAIDEFGRKREIDVLLLAGNEILDEFAIPVPIECKNYGDNVGVERIDAFFGKLHDIGVPTNLGIFVSTVGFTDGALKRAKAAGISTLLIDGLEDDRLSVKVKEVLSAIVFWIAEWKQTSHLPFVPSIAQSWSVADMAPGKPWKLASLDAMWQLWMRGKIPMELGEHTVRLLGRENEMAICDVVVTAHTFFNQAALSSTSLRDAESNQTRLRSTEVRGQNQPTSSIALQRHTTETSLHSVTSAAHSVMNIKVPRIAGPKLIWWPPSKESLERLEELKTQGRPVNLENVEGFNILRAWPQKLNSK
jgi:hypothetical protein